MTIEAYPLTWPAGWKRLSSNIYREEGLFKQSMARAVNDMINEIAMLVGRHRQPNVILSSNLRVRLDGLPLAKQRAPDDPGVAVYFDYRDSQRVFACDRYKRIEHNIRAIGLTIEALRGIERWGASDMLERAFTGFLALPNLPAEPWWMVLGLQEDADWEVIDRQARKLRSAYHPDHEGGSDYQFDRVQKAFDAAREARFA